MAKTVVGLFDRFEQAQSALDDLAASGFSREDLSIVMHEQTGRKAGIKPSRGERGGAAEGAASGAGVGAASGAALGGAAGLLAGVGAIAIPGFGALLAAGPIVGLLSGAGIGAGVGAVAGGLIGALTNAGVPEEQANLYAESVRRGGTLLMLHEENDERADEAADLMDRHGAVDIEERAGMLRGGAAAMETGGTEVAETGGAPAGAMPGRTMEPRAGEVREGEIHEQVIEEQMRVGKREVGRGGVRVYSRVTERPVSEQVRLREEHVRVERRPADRPATPEELAAGQEEVIIRETGEEPVVQKEPRVVEEVVLSKESEEHIEEVPGTVKRRDIEVERIPGQEAGMAAGAMELEPEFRQHYQREFTTGEQFEQVAPAYRYGSQLSADRRFQGRSWDEVRQDVRSDWESRNPGTFERIEGAIRYAYDRARGRGGSGGGTRT